MRDQPTQKAGPCFSLKDYLLGQHGADEIAVQKRIQLLGALAQHRRFVSIRNMVARNG